MRESSEKQFYAFNALRPNCAFAMLNFFSVYIKFYETDSRAKGIFWECGIFH